MPDYLEDEAFSPRRKKLLPRWAYMFAGFILLAAVSLGRELALEIIAGSWMEIDGTWVFSMDVFDLPFLILFAQMVLNIIASIALFLHLRPAVNLALAGAALNVIFIIIALANVDVLTFALLALLLLVLVLYIRLLWRIRKLWAQGR